MTKAGVPLMTQAELATINLRSVIEDLKIDDTLKERYQVYLDLLNANALPVACRMQGLL